MFEIHWGIERPTSSFAIDIEGLWARSRTATLEGVPVRLLSFEGGQGGEKAAAKHTELRTVFRKV